MALELGHHHYPFNHQRYRQTANYELRNLYIVVACTTIILFWPLRNTVVMRFSQRDFKENVFLLRVDACRDKIESIAQSAWH